LALTDSGLFSNTWALTDRAALPTGLIATSLSILMKRESKSAKATSRLRQLFQ